MRIKRSLHFRGSVGRADLCAVFEPAVSYSRISAEHAAILAAIRCLPEPQELESLDDSANLKAKQVVVLDFYLNDLRLSDEFMVMPVADADAIIGALTMRKWHIKLDTEQDKVITDPRAGKHILR